MAETKRQKQVAGLLNEELNAIFLRHGLNMINGGMVSIADVKISPDLFEAKVYLSLFKIENRKEALKKIEDKASEIRKDLGNSIRHQMRSIPNISYYIDETLDYVDNIENLFSQIKKEDERIAKENSKKLTDN